MQITINSVAELKAKNSGKTFWKVNDAYTIFDKDLAQLFIDNKGRGCDVVVETKGDYKNIRQAPIFLTKKKEEQEEIETPKPEKMGSVSQDRNNVIIAQCLTKCAVGKDGDKCEEVWKAYCFFIEKLR
tara:strand:- start:201 stop:584 length:384 start_codon:yes stop_codon:yes gene_type:complete